MEPMIEQRFAVLQLGPGMHVIDLGRTSTIKEAINLANIYMAKKAEVFVPDAKKAIWRTGSAAVHVLLDTRAGVKSFKPITIDEALILVRAGACDIPFDGDITDHEKGFMFTRENRQKSYLEGAKAAGEFRELGLEDFR